MRASSTDNEAAGVLCAAGAFGIWGLLPIYFKAVGHVPAPEVVAHRAAWSMLLLAAILFIRRGGIRLLSEFGDRRRLGLYLLTTTLIGVNWLIYIWAVQEARLLEASLGYFINPLIYVLLGVAFLGERLNAWQIAAVALAGIGVLILVIGYGRFPWVSLSLAATFALYGLLRKKAGMDPLLGLFVETLLITPFALLFLAVTFASGTSAFGHVDLRTDALLISAGVITAVPLLLFLEAARRLRLSTVGLMQYLTPTLQFLLAVLVYREPFSRMQMVTFVCIWTALALYSYDAFNRRRRAARSGAHETAPLTS